MADTLQFTTTPKVWVGCLASYNNGHLHGRCMNVVDYDTLMENIQSMLKDSPMPDAEEWKIFDTEYLPKNYDKYNLADLCKLGAWLAEDEDMADVKIEFMENFGYDDVDDARSGFEDRYMGEHGSLYDYAVQLFDECYLHDIPESVRNYIDYAKFARDLQYSGDYVVLGNGHIFSCC